MSDLDIDIQREVLRDLGRAFDPAAYGPRAKAGRIAVLAAAVAIAAASGGTLGAGERTERAALWLSAATDVAATKYGQVACERDPYCHSATERGWLGRLVVGDSATGWQPLLVKAGTTLMIDLASRELGRDGARAGGR